MNGRGVFTEQEKYRLDVITLCLDKKITNAQAATFLVRSIRQVQRIKASVRVFGVQGVIHKLKGKPSNHRKSKTT